MARTTATATIETQYLDDFSGGTNLIEAPWTLPAPFLPGGNFNVTLRGRHLVSRFGAILAGTLGASSKYVFYAPKIDVLLSQEGTGLYRYSVNSAMQTITGRTNVTTFSTSDKIQACEFAGVIVVVHPVDGVFTLTSGFVWALATAAVKGSCICAWQNKCWVGGDPSNPSRIWWSNAGSPTTWTTATDFVDLREVNDYSVTAIGVGNGMDVVGRGSMQVFKGTSSYRIYSSSTGAYITIDAYRGAATSESVTSVAGHIYFCNQYGVYRLDGDTVVTLSDAIRPDWDAGDLYTNPYTMWASWDRLYVSNIGSAVSNYKHYWELIPEKSAWFPHGFRTSGSSVYAVYSATRFAKGPNAATPLNASLVLASDQVSVMVMPHHPSGMTSASSTRPVPTDFYDSINGGGYGVAPQFALPVIHRGDKRFTIQSLRVQGWNSLDADNDCRMFFAGHGEYATGAAAYSDFRLSAYGTISAGMYGAPAAPIGAYTSLRPVVTTAPTAVTSTGIVGNQYGTSSGFYMPAAGISAIEARLVIHE